MDAASQIYTAKMLIGKLKQIDAIREARGGSYPGMNHEMISISRQMAEITPENVAIAERELREEGK